MPDADQESSDERKCCSLEAMFYVYVGLFLVTNLILLGIHAHSVVRISKILEEVPKQEIIENVRRSALETTRIYAIAYCGPAAIGLLVSALGIIGMCARKSALILLLFVTGIITSIACIILTILSGILSVQHGWVQNGALRLFFGLLLFAFAIFMLYICMRAYLKYRRFEKDY